MLQRKLTQYYSPSTPDPLARQTICEAVGLTTSKIPTAACSSTKKRAPGGTPLTDTKRRKRKTEEGTLHQMILDVGQKRIGLEHCSSCGMVYCVDEKRDVEQHNAFHNRFLATAAFRVSSSQLTRWTGQLAHEKTTAPVPGLLFVLNSASEASLKRKIEDLIKEFVNEELGYAPDLPTWVKNRHALVFVRCTTPAVLTANATTTNGASGGQKRAEAAFLAGLILVDKVMRVTLMPQQKEFRGGFLGINRIWIHAQMRRKGLATYMLDVARRLLVAGGTLPRKRIAFSEPTEAGIKLARAYLAGDSQANNSIEPGIENVAGGQTKEAATDEKESGSLSGSYIIYLLDSVDAEEEDRNAKPPRVSKKK